MHQRVKPHVCRPPTWMNHFGMGLWSLSHSGHNTGCKKANKTSSAFLSFYQSFFFLTRMRLVVLRKASERKNASVYLTPLPFSASSVPHNVTCWAAGLRPKHPLFPTLDRLSTSLFLLRNKGPLSSSTSTLSFTLNQLKTASKSTSEPRTRAVRCFCPRSGSLHTHSDFVIGTRVGTVIKRRKEQEPFDVVICQTYVC